MVQLHSQSMKCAHVFDGYLSSMIIEEANLERAKEGLRWDELWNSAKMFLVNLVGMKYIFDFMGFSGNGKVIGNLV